MQVDGPPVSMYTYVSHHWPPNGGLSTSSIYPCTQTAATTDMLAEPHRLLGRMWFTLRAKHYAYRTEQAYVPWVRRGA